MVRTCSSMPRSRKTSRVRWLVMWARGEFAVPGYFVTVMASTPDRASSALAVSPAGPAPTTRTSVAVARMKVLLPPVGRVVNHAEVQSVHPVPDEHRQEQLPPQVVAEEPDIGSGEVHPRNHEGTTDGRQDGAEDQPLEGVAECGRPPPQQRLNRD